MDTLKIVIYKYGNVEDAASSGHISTGSGPYSYSSLEFKSWATQCQPTVASPALTLPLFSLTLFSASVNPLHAPSL